MFRCKNCGSTEFKLLLQPSFEGNVDVSVNAKNEVVITVNERSFVADLMFMNQFSICKSCDAIGLWAYMEAAD